MKNMQKAKVLININWYDKSINILSNKESINLTNKLSPNIVDNLNSITNNNQYRYPLAPDILEIEDEEKFKNSDGQIINITIRGKRESKECYFRVKDVSKEFDMERLQGTLIHEDGSYKLNKHYKYFTIVYNGNPVIDDSKNELYLTYIGMLKVLFSSRSGNAETFQEWASDTLFTVHLGNEENKYELVKSMFGGASIHAIKEAFKVSSGKTPCVYLFVIGSAKKLIDENKYSDNDLLLKYGYTDDLPRRSTEHERNYRKLFNIEHIELICFSVIDPKYTADAETSISNYFKTDKVEFNTSKELVVLNKSELDKTKKHFNMIKNSYIGCYKEMSEKINELEQRLKDEQNKHELTRKDYECYQKKSIKELELIKERLTNELELTKEKFKSELELKNKDIESLRYTLKKELEIANLKTQLLEIKIAIQ